MNKHIAIILFFTLYLTKALFAQFSIGPKLGINFTYEEADYTLPEGLQRSVDLKGHIGLTAEIKLNKLFYLKPELYYTTKSRKFRYSEDLGTDEFGVNYDYRFVEKTIIEYVELPINLMLKTPGDVKFVCYAGAYVAFGLSGKAIHKHKLLRDGIVDDKEVFNYDFSFTNRVSDQNINEKGFARNKDYGINLGIGLEVDRLQFLMVLQLGLQNLNPHYENVTMDVINENETVSTSEPFDINARSIRSRQNNLMFTMNYVFGVSNTSHKHKVYR